MTTLFIEFLSVLQDLFPASFLVLSKSILGLVAFTTMLTLPFSYVVSYGSELFFGVLSNPMLLELIQCSKSFWTGIAFIVLGFVVVIPGVFL